MPQSRSQKATVGRVMHEYKHHELRSGSGRKVRNPRQAIAIALNEAGASNQESPAENHRNLARTKAKERAGRTAEAEKEGRGSQDATLRTYGATRQELYDRARQRGVPGRSRMTKAELARALADA